MIGAVERWTSRLVLNILGIRNSVFALMNASKSSGNQARAKGFTGLVPVVLSEPSPGIK